MKEVMVWAAGRVCSLCYRRKALEGLDAYHQADGRLWATIKSASFINSFMHACIHTLTQQLLIESPSMK